MRMTFSPLLPALTATIAIAIFVLDSLTRINMAIAVLYVVVVMMSAGFCTRREVIAVSGACMVLTVLGFVIMQGNDYDDTSIGQCIVALSANAITTFLAVRMQSATDSIRDQAQLFDLSHDSIFVRDMHDVITYWNHGAKESYGWPRAQALGQISHRLFQTQFPATGDEALVQLLHTGRWEGELVHTRRDGTRMTVASRWSLQRDEQGRPIAILLFEPRPPDIR
jgi:two-component system, LuxR family, sensor kinase FixL